MLTTLRELFEESTDTCLANCSPRRALGSQPRPEPSRLLQPFSLSVCQLFSVSNDPVVP